MTIARAHLVDPSVTRWYHCITRCVRRAFLLSEGTLDRKQWIEDRCSVDSSREGTIEGFTLGNYVLLLEYIGRLFRGGKASISREVTAIF